MDCLMIVTVLWSITGCLMGWKTPSGGGGSIGGADGASCAVFIVLMMAAAKEVRLAMVEASIEGHRNGEGRIVEWWWRSCDIIRWWRWEIAWRFGWRIEAGRRNWQGRMIWGRTHLERMGLTGGFNPRHGWSGSQTGSGPKMDPLMLSGVALVPIVLVYFRTIRCRQSYAVLNKDQKWKPLPPKELGWRWGDGIMLEEVILEEEWEKHLKEFGQWCLIHKLTKMNDEGQSSSNDVGRESSLMIGSSRRRSKRNRKIVDLSCRFLEGDDHTQKCTTFRRNSRRRSLMTAYNMETNCQPLPVYEDIGNCDNVGPTIYFFPLTLFDFLSPVISFTLFLTRKHPKNAKASMINGGFIITFFQQTPSSRSKSNSIFFFNALEKPIEAVLKNPFKPIFCTKL
ncbi:hypothetical protein LXL04_032679 [Taraxacum kok-saghyz]